MSIHFRDEFKQAVSHPLRSIVAAPFYYGGRAVAEVGSKVGLNRKNIRDISFLSNPVTVRDIQDKGIKRAGVYGYGTAALVAGGYMISGLTGAGAGAAGAGASAAPSIPSTIGSVAGTTASGLINTGVSAALPDLLPNKNKPTSPDEKTDKNNTGIYLIGGAVIGIIIIIFALRR